MCINYGRDLKGIAFVKRPGVTAYTSGGSQASYVINSSKKLYICIYVRTGYPKQLIWIDLYDTDLSHTRTRKVSVNAHAA